VLRADVGEVLPAVAARLDAGNAGADGGVDADGNVDGGVDAAGNADGGVDADGNVDGGVDEEAG
jgi:hypothetical protein